MKKGIIAFIWIFVCVIAFSSSSYIGTHEQVTLSEVTANHQTDRIIGKYMDPGTGKIEYKAVEAKDIIDFTSLTVAGGRKTYFKCRNEADDAILEMEYVQPDYIRRIYSEPAGEPTADIRQGWGIERISSDDFSQMLSERLKGNKNTITVAVVDTGTDLNHSFLKNRLVNGYDFVDSDEDPSNTDDEEDHGTHVSGIIAASTPGNVKIMPVRVLSIDGGYDYDISQGILFAVQNGADVINLSLGGPKYSPFMDVAINYALSKNIIVVASAGNDALDTKAMFPAQKQEIIVVSATNQDDDIALFSNYGESVDICAPGDDIFSSVPGDKYASMDGTSMSAPFISAVCAILKLEDNRRSTVEVENILKTYTDDLGTPGWDKAFGAGLVNMDAYTISGSDFLLISPTREGSFCDGISVKYYVKENIGSTVRFYIDSSLKKTIKVQTDGFNTQVLDLKRVSKGVHTLRVELSTTAGIKKSESVEISKLAYNTSFELLDINNERIDGPLVYLYWIKDGKSGFVKVENQKIEDNIIYMNLDMDSLLKKYDKIVAVASSDHYHPDNLDAPIYIKNIVSTGKKTFNADSVQYVRVTEEIPFDLYNGGLSIPYNQAYFTPFIDGQYIFMEYPIMKNFPGSKGFFIEEGAHKVSIYTPYYKSVIQLDGFGINEVILTTDENTKVTATGIKGTNGDIENNKFFYHVQKRGLTDISVFNGYAYEKDRSEYVGDGNYVVSMNRETDGNNVNFKKFFTLNSGKSKKYNIQAGGTITNKFIVDYSNNALKVNLYFMDSFGNIVTSFWCKKGDGSENLRPGVILKGKSKSFAGSEVRADVPGIDGYSYIFTGQNIPDGDYVLQVRLDKPIPIFKAQLTDMPVKIKGGRFMLAKSNSAPQSTEETLVIVADKYETAQLDLKSVIKDVDGDKLYYRTNKGYIQNDTFYLETSNVGIQDAEITAMDFKGGSAKIQLYIIVTDGSVLYLPEPDQDETISLNGASIDLVDELLDAYQNNLIISRLAGSYGHSTNRDEFSELIMRFYAAAGGEEITTLPKNPFKDTKNSDVLRAYSIGAMKGIGSGRFAPGDNITRLQVCEAITAVMRKLKPEINQKNTYVFSDSGKLSVSSQESLGFCYQYGIIMKDKDNKIDPDAPVSRENALVMINRAFNSFAEVDEGE